MTTTHEPRFVEVFDTTLRDGLQVEGVSATVEDKLRIAEQLDLLGVQLHRGRLARRQPEGHRVLRPRRDRAAARPRSTLVAFGSTRRPRGKVDDDATLRNLLEAGTPAVCIVAKSSDYHVTRGAADHARRGRGDDRRLGASSSPAHGRRVLVDMEHFFDGYKAQPGVLAAGPRGGGRQRAPRHVVLCDTNGGSLPARGRARSSPTSTATSAPTSSSASTATTTPAAPSPTRWPPSRPAPATCRARSTASASAPATPTSPRSSPTCSSSSAYRCLPEGRIERLTAVSHHVAELLNRPLNPQAPYVGSSAFAHKAGLHVQRHRAGQGRLRARRPGAGRQRHPLRRVSEMAGRATIKMKADELGLDDGRPGDQRR